MRHIWRALNSVYAEGGALGLFLRLSGVGGRKNEVAGIVVNSGDDALRDSGGLEPVFSTKDNGSVHNTVPS